jgi:hypothetical protein
MQTKLLKIHHIIQPLLKGKILTFISILAQNMNSATSYPLTEDYFFRFNLQNTAFLFSIPKAYL